ncbi:autoinducer binding domain-containing protein [Pseudomonas sp. D(2018)]|uniref:autoinducer binding domain-containing protein n=1 Tax=Pseudomonas sp. D(2018) TaxID=2502238 RepID=UPI0010F8C35D|nr:autoinducer binding domain-containing protein [Pseudomonas sp. D(2018)]
MHHWQSDLLQTAMFASDVNVFLDQVIRVAHGLGFAYVAYGSRQLFPLSRERPFVINNYPLSWQAAYVANGYLNIDPYVKKALSSAFPVIWDAELKARVPSFWEDAGAHGLVEGWGQSILSRGQQSLVTFARPSEPITIVELRSKQAKLSWLGNITHLGMERVRELGQDTGAECFVHLSQREKEVLKWTADGKTAADVSIILNISERTVNFHIQSCLQKLDCQSKISAAVKASLMGLLWG